MNTITKLATKRVVKLTSMFLLLSLALLMLASDSIGSVIFLDNTSVKLEESGDLVIKGDIDIYDDNDSIFITKTSLHIDVKFYKLVLRDGCRIECENDLSKEDCQREINDGCSDEILIFEKKYIDFTLNNQKERDTKFELILKNTDIKMYEETKETNYKIELEFSYQAGDSIISAIDYIDYKYIPKVNPCKEVTCSNHGKCELDNNGEAKCNCDENYVEDKLECFEEI